MNAPTTAGYVLVLTHNERRTLLDVLEAVLTQTEVELHRTEAFAARAVVGTKVATIQSLLNKVREAAPAEGPAGVVGSCNG